MSAAFTRSVWPVVCVVAALHLLLLIGLASQTGQYRQPELTVISGLLIQAPATTQVSPQTLRQAVSPSPAPPNVAAETRSAPVVHPDRSPVAGRPLQQRVQASSSESRQLRESTGATAAAASTAWAATTAPAPSQALSQASSQAPSQSYSAPTPANDPGQESSPKPALPLATVAPETTPNVVPPRSDAAHLNNPPPTYPPVSRRIGEAGQVMLEVHIQPDGSVGEIRVKRSSGFDRLDEAAIRAVRHWRYLPARRGDQAIAWWYLQPIIFSLNS